MDPSSNIPPGALPHKKHEDARRILFYGCCLKSPPPPYKAPILKKHISPDIFFSQVNTLKGISKVPAAVDLLRLDTLRGPTFLTPTRYDEQPYPFYMGAPPPHLPPGTYPLHLAYVHYLHKSHNTVHLGGYLH